MALGRRKAHAQATSLRDLYVNIFQVIDSMNEIRRLKWPRNWRFVTFYSIK
ncbi:hypothetical protein CEV34_0108 [Brucella pseudogrignonensis]|uniref:Uncharacterized protein n=1 Tax=Brucella pseudogrignonensis TaxID=419475 RepID=A0A256GUD3_9HYPH|nr:hypothetical protein CEV34_0108 [Brucella pseudogrignonensis]